MNPNEYIFELVNKTLTDSSLKLSEVIRQAARIAKLRNDYLNYWWLELELINLTDESQEEIILTEISSELTIAQAKYFQAKFRKMWSYERKFNDNKIVAKPLAEDENQVLVLCYGVITIENDIEQWSDIIDVELSKRHSNQGLNRLKERHSELTVISARNQIKNCKEILSRIKNRVNIYLSGVEKQLIFGQFQSDIFEENRSYVDKKLAELCPNVLNKFVSAYKRLGENNPESWAQAITSCRRLLESLADTLYPPTDKIIVGSDGKERKLTKDKYIMRLWQYISENIPKSTAGSLLQVQIEDYGNRIDKLYAMTNKGVHAEISKFEVNQCVIQTYLMIGDLLRIKQETSVFSED
jgi:hypothetical protein